MHDRRDKRFERGRARRDQDGEHRRHGERHGHDRDRGEGRGGGSGSDTRFLQLEMSEVLYAEAEAVTKQALRDLLLEEAKVRFRERFGDEITGLAQLAVDELMQDVLASLQVEARIHERNRDRQSRRERLSGILRAGSDRGEGNDEQRDREEADGEEGGGAGSDEDR
jgi:hypothetical protein